MSLPPNQGQPPAITLQELEDALTLSENLNNRIKKLQTEHKKIVSVLILTWIFFIPTASYVSLTINNHLTNLIHTIFAVSITGLSVISVYFYFYTIKFNQELSATKEDANRIFSLIHESKDLVYLTQPVGLLKKAELEIRLSRLASYAPRTSTARSALSPSPAPTTDPSHAR